MDVEKFKDSEEPHARRTCNVGPQCVRNSEVQEKRNVRRRESSVKMAEMLHTFLVVRIYASIKRFFKTTLSPLRCQMVYTKALY